MEIGTYTPGQKENCRACGQPAWESFNWQMAMGKRTGTGSTLEKELLARAEALHHEKKLKLGDLYRCGTCGQHCYLDERELFMSRVSPERFPLLMRWHERQLRPNPEHLAMLERIGGTGSTVAWTPVLNFVSIPCRIVRSSGDELDPAIVVMTPNPPIHSWYERVALFEDVRSLEPTECALPLDVRIAAFTAPEIRMGFAPTRVRAVNGQRFVLNGSQSVLQVGEIKGKGIRRSRWPWDVFSGPFVPPDGQLAVYVFADWFPGAERLIRAAPRSWWSRWFG
jgi:hypothetical protein